MRKFKATKSAIFSWALFDWANSGFAVVISTFVFSAYFTEKIAINKFVGTQQWGMAIGIAAFVIAIMSPILGSIADYEGRRKPWLALFSIISIAATALLWFAYPSHHYVLFTLICVILGTIGVDVGMVFYNAMLKDLVPANYIGRLSGWAWGFGYFGGLACLIIALFIFVENRLGWLDASPHVMENIRIVGPLVAAWFLVFGWPIFLFTPDSASSGRGLKESVSLGIRKLIHTLRNVAHYREIVIFLIARILYIDGLNTIFAFGGIYAAGTFHMSFSEVIQFGIGMNIAAGIGSMFFAWMDDYKGAKPTILTTLIIMSVAGIGMLIVKSKLEFWILGMVLSICVGPIQAASRSLMIHLAPEEMLTEMFGLYALSGKATAFIGPWLVGFVTAWSQSQRIGMSTVMIFIISGAIVLSFVNVNHRRHKSS